MTHKKMGMSILCMVLSALVILGMITVFLDPFFHYHAPFSFQKYTLYNQRYQNDGISRHFDYDAIITGTSVTENFLTSECDELFGVHSIKCCFSGASYKEINDFLTLAVERQPNTQLIIRSLDTQILLDDKDAMAYDSYPTYLYDDNVFNDTSYLLNKDVLLSDVWPAIVQTIKDLPSDTFDEYSYWANDHSYGKDVIMNLYNRPERLAVNSFTEQDAQIVRDTINQNYIAIAKSNPNIDFYVFLTPYSVIFWDSWNQKGDLQRNLQAQQLAIELLLEQDNIHVFSFLDDFDLVSNLNRYKDTIHYDAQANSDILQAMALGEHQITKENASAYFENVYQYYTTYSYESLFE